MPKTRAPPCSPRRCGASPAQWRMPVPSSSPGRSAAWPSLVFWLVLTLAAGSLGAIASAQAPAFYASLVRPAWAPPASWFGPVWTLLYLLMAVAVWGVWRVQGRSRGLGPYLLYVAQLLVNAAWTWLFFSVRSGAAAFADIVLLLVLIVATMALFARVRTWTAWLLLPYLAWVMFATALSWTVWQLNPSLLG